jgi:cathepsin A (carboxypeptidase C)
MKLAISLSLVGAATALASKQHPFHLPDQLPEAAQDAWSKHMHKIEEALGGLTEEAQAAWEDVAEMYPEDMARAKANMISYPKKHTRRASHEWDHIVHGQDIQVALTEEGEKDQTLHSYDLRIKKVDPSVLQVDPGVKQYSGYLDDNADDKHLFYCKYPTAPYPTT